VGKERIENKLFKILTFMFDTHNLKAYVVRVLSTQYMLFWPECASQKPYMVLRENLAFASF